MTNILELQAKQILLVSEQENGSDSATVCHDLLSELTSMLDGYSSEEVSFEMGDLVNEMGLLIGKYNSDVETLVTDFQHGMDYGIELSKAKQ